MLPSEKSDSRRLPQSFRGMWRSQRRHGGSVTGERRPQAYHPPPPLLMGNGHCASGGTHHDPSQARLQRGKHYQLRFSTVKPSDQSENTTASAFMDGLLILWMQQNRRARCLYSPPLFFLICSLRSLWTGIPDSKGGLTEGWATVASAQTLKSNTVCLQQPRGAHKSDVMGRVV